MDTKIINAYHGKSQRLLSSGLVIVDAALEPLKVLKVLMEGLGPDRKAGLWLTNFRGVPVARTLSPFDLIYLDKDYGVVHCVEISTEGEYEPFRGDPASALVLPPKTIAMSKTRVGDKLMFRTVDDPQVAPAEPEQTAVSQDAPISKSPPAQPATAHFFNSAFPAPPAQSGGSPLDQFLGARSISARGSTPAASATAVAEAPTARAASASPSGRLTKSAKSILEQSPILRPSGDGESIAAALEGSQVSILIASEPGAHASHTAAERATSAPLSSRVVPASTRNSFNGAPDHALEARTPNGSVSGRLMKSVNLAPAMPPEVQPEPPIAEATTAIVPKRQTSPNSKRRTANPAIAPAVEQDHESHPEPTLGTVIPITAAVAHIPQSEPVSPPPILAPAAETHVASPVAAAAPALVPGPVPVPAELPTPARNSLPTVISPAPAVRTPASQPSSAGISPRIKEIAPPQAQPKAAPTVLPAKKETAGSPKTDIQTSTGKNGAEAPRKAKPSWDVQLLYLLFPEFDPSRPPEIRIPRMDQQKEAVPDEDEKQSKKLQFLCWLYPNLHLDKVEQKRSEERRAVRLPLPGLVAYFFTGGSPRPHPIKDISVTGFYMCTDERWLPGTIIRVTLQMVGTSGEGGRDTITVHSRVVRWGPDGGGFEFVLPGFLET
ncbi:MAG: hypothetical protein ABSE96_05925 [Terracidiphilus sp.]